MQQTIHEQKKRRSKKERKKNNIINSTIQPRNTKQIN